MVDIDLRDLHENAKVVVLFRSQLTRDAGPDYEKMSDEMIELASEMPGFIDYRSYVSQMGERLAVIWWESHEAVDAWREHSRHRYAQRYGREKWYAWFAIEVADRVRGHGFERP